jgi:NitT/TauT family transport system ATP-binding protein
MGFRCFNLKKIYPSGMGEVSSLENATFAVQEHEFVCIVGPSGCGKTTLLRIIAGLLEPTSGEIIFDNHPQLNQPRTAMVFQEVGLFPWMTSLENMVFGLEMQGLLREERERRAHDFIERFGLTGFTHSYPHELSGGMRQRVAIARAFLADPQILLMDEPFGALDAQTRLVLQQELLRIWKEHNKTIVYVTHDIEEAILLGDRVLVMTGRPGSIREEIHIPLSRPRDLTVESDLKVLEIKWHIWKMLEDEVRKALQVRL